MKTMLPNGRKQKELGQGRGKDQLAETLVKLGKTLIEGIKIVSILFLFLVVLYILILNLPESTIQRIQEELDEYIASQPIKEYNVGILEVEHLKEDQVRLKMAIHLSEEVIKVETKQVNFRVNRNLEANKPIFEAVYVETDIEGIETKGFHNGTLVVSDESELHDKMRKQVEK